MRNKIKHPRGRADGVSNPALHTKSATFRDCGFCYGSKGVAVKGSCLDLILDENLDFKTWIYQVSDQDMAPDFHFRMVDKLTEYEWSSHWQYNYERGQILLRALTK